MIEPTAAVVAGAEPDIAPKKVPAATVDMERPPVRCPKNFSATEGTISEYESSPGIWRGFCGTCGSPLTFRGEGWNDVAITIASLDDPNSITPESNVYLKERLHWVRFNEDMRNYDGFPD